MVDLVRGRFIANDDAFWAGYKYIYMHSCACSIVYVCACVCAGKTGVMADRDKIEFRLFISSSIFNITLREELFSYRGKTTP